MPATNAAGMVAASSDITVETSSMTSMAKAGASGSPSAGARRSDRPRPSRRRPSPGRTSAARRLRLLPPSTARRERRSAARRRAPMAQAMNTAQVGERRGADPGEGDAAAIPSATSPSIGAAVARGSSANSRDHAASSTAPAAPRAPVRIWRARLSSRLILRRRAAASGSVAPARSALRLHLAHDTRHAHATRRAPIMLSKGLTSG